MAFSRSENKGVTSTDASDAPWKVTRCGTQSPGERQRVCWRQSDRCRESQFVKPEANWRARKHRLHHARRSTPHRQAAGEETKGRTGKLRPAQGAFVEAVRAAGGVAIVVRDAAEL